MRKTTARRLLASIAIGAGLAAGCIHAIPAHATPGQCIQASGFGGFCDSLPVTRDGVYRHCENALGFLNCYLVRPVPTTIDPKGWQPA